MELQAHTKPASPLSFSSLTLGQCQCLGYNVYSLNGLGIYLGQNSCKDFPDISEINTALDKLFRIKGDTLGFLSMRCLSEVFLLF